MSTEADINKDTVELPKNLTSQNVKFHGNESSTSLKDHQNASVNPYDLITSTNQKTKVPENKQGGNIEPSNTSPQNESPLLEPNNETTTIDEIPHSEFHPALIRGTVYTADTHKDYFMDKAVQHTDPKIKGITGVTLCDSDINNLSVENIGFVVKKNLNSDPEIGQIFDHTAGILEDTDQSSVFKKCGILEDTIQNIDSETGGILECTDRSDVSEIINVIQDTTQISAILEGSVKSTVLKISGSLEDNNQSIVVKIGGIAEDDDLSIDSEIGGNLHNAFGMIQRLSQHCVDELSNKNVLKAIDNNTISDIQTDSTVNAVKTDMTQMSESFTVNEKTDAEQASCLSEDLVANMTVNNITQNNPGIGLLISSFPHAPIQIPSKTGKGIDFVSYSSDTSKELWADALDEWGCLPVLCPSLSSSDSTKTQKTEAKCGSLEPPTVESWSSSDSWASALSDWIQSVKVLPEDSNTSPASHHQCFITEEKSTGLQNNFESGNGYFKDKISIRPPVDLSVLYGEEKENRFVTKSDMSKQYVKDETQSGVQEEEDESEDNYNKKRLENKCLSKQESNALWEVTEDTAFEEEGERDHGGLSFSCYPVLPESEGYLQQEHLTGSREGFSCREVDFIMPLTPLTIGTSFLHLKEDPDESRTSLNLSIRPDLTQGFRGKSPSKSSDKQFCDILKITGDQESSSSSFEDRKYKTPAGDVSSELQKLIFPTAERLMICEEKQVAYVTLDLDDVLNLKKQNLSSIKHITSEVCERDSKMPRKNQKNSSENKPNLNKHKDKMNKNQQQKRENMRPEDSAVKSGGVEDSVATVIETIVITEKATSRSQGKKKKKHGTAKVENEPLLVVENGTKPKNLKPKNETTTKPASKLKEKLARYEEKETKANDKTDDVKSKPSTETLSVCLPDAQDDDIIKRRRISGDKPGPVSIRTRPQLPAIFQQRKNEVVVTQTSQTPEVPHVISEIEAAPVVDDPQSISLWCNFSHMTVDSSVIWLKEGATLHEEKRKAGDDTRVSLSLLKASRKDLGFYRCTLISACGSVSTLDYHLTSEVLMELIISSYETPAECEAVDGQEEDVSCAPLLFKEDILTDQYFGEQQQTSIVTEKDHFGEGMHRKAFRTMLLTGMTPLFDPGHACVLKVHSSIGYGAQNDDEVVQKNYNLAVEECYVQNTAREYIKAYTDIAKSAESFGEVPEIIPIVLVHRPSNSIPYATLEEELIGDFVKYSVKDGKEINLKRRDSEAGQKCCAFQHWVYTQTDGNLLITDMQGVGMKLTDVGIATCKKGYKGFKGNCSTSFIDQFKALHQCNRFCELLGLMSLQPKPKWTAPPNSNAQPAARKKTFGPNVKGKS